MGYGIHHKSEAVRQSVHCEDLRADRNLGELWERNFCKLAAEYGLSFTPHQIGNSQSVQSFKKANGTWHAYTLPDITIWTAPGQHHEVKHKEPFVWRDCGPCFGLEKYRFDALMWFHRETEQRVYYTIHNHALSGGRESRINEIEHWITVDVASLVDSHIKDKATNSYVNGQVKRVPILYWPVSMWQPLERIFLQDNDRISIPKTDELTIRGRGLECSLCGGLLEMIEGELCCVDCQYVIF